MSEPIDPPIATPRGGWPHACLTVDVGLAPNRELAFYALACAARRLRSGVVAELEGVRIYAFPHQSVDEIARGFLRERQALTPPIAAEPATVVHEQRRA